MLFPDNLYAKPVKYMLCVYFINGMGFDPRHAPEYNRYMDKILIVEDDKVIIENLTAFLQSENFTVDAASGQKEALSLLERNSYDLVLLDISLRDGNGYALCSAVKNSSSTPVIFVTASDDEFSVVAGLDMGADDYISKPYRPRELLSRIRSVLRRTGKTSSIL